jgi:hypothetical protein
LSLDTHVSGNDVVMNNWQTATVAPTNLTSASESVIKQIGAAPGFAWCGRATLTLVLEYFVTEPPLKATGRHAMPHEQPRRPT